MAIKDLAVAYNGSDNAKAAFDLAVQMCRKYDATLTGICAVNPVRFEGNVAQWVPEDVIARLKEAEGEVTKSIEASFRAQAAEAGLNGGTDFMAEEGQANVVLARHARYFDALLIGQSSKPLDPSRPIRAEDLVLRTGRPLLVVPHGHAVRPFREYAAIAWDGSRAAARALSDAMQILETKKRLDVVSVHSGRGGGAPPSDVMRHLSRHGIDARHVPLTAARDGVGATILAYCAENGPDILVMGAYGHAKLREDLFGGVTRHVMQHMTVPVLMSH